MGFFMLDNKPSTDFGVGLSGSGTWGTPEREIETAKIPGRSGRLITYVGAWQNVEITYPAWIARRFEKKFDAFVEWWNAHTDNYYKLTDTYHPEYFRMARPVSKIDPEVGTLNRSGRFDLTFDCKPQKYLNDGDIKHVIPDSGQIILKNPTGFDAYPLIIAKLPEYRSPIDDMTPEEVDAMTTEELEEIEADYRTYLSSYNPKLTLTDERENWNATLTFTADDGIREYIGYNIEFDTETHEATCDYPTGIVSANTAVTEEYFNETSAFCIPAGERVTLESWLGDFEIYPRWYRI